MAKKKTLKADKAEKMAKEKPVDKTKKKVRSATEVRKAMYGSVEE